MASDEENLRAYPLPGKSKVETNRLDGQHAIFTSRMGGLYRTPFPADFSPTRTLDIGCGTGIWTRAFARAHTSSSVTGIDLNPPSERFAQDASTPDNCSFVKADWDSFMTAHDASHVAKANSRKDALIRYDFIYMRMLMAAVRNWPALLRKAFENLVPGGTLELFEGLMEMNAEDGSTGETSAAIRWFQMAQHYMTAHDIKWDAALDLPLQLRDAGFEEVEDQPLKMKLYRDGDEESWVGVNYAQDMASLVDGMGPRIRADPSSSLTEQEWDVLEKDAKRELITESEKRGFYTALHIFLAKKH